jgi:hypothetical protein
MIETLCLLKVLRSGPQNSGSLARLVMDGWMDGCMYVCIG